MSDAMNRIDFENMMDEYLRGELSRSREIDFDKYLEQHPDACLELEEVREVITLTEMVATGNPPQNLEAKVAAGLRQQLSISGMKSNKWFQRPLFAWSFVLSLVLLVGLTLWPTNSSFVYARLIDNLKNIDSVKVEGWIRGESGEAIAYRQWVIADGTLRAELGEEKHHQRIVVLKGNERQIKDYDGKLYHDNSKVRWTEDLESVLTMLQATYQNPEIAQSCFEYSKEDLGETVRFMRHDPANLGHGGSHRKWVLEVDKKTALPTLMQFHQQIAGRWIQISNLRFSEFDSPPSADHFILQGPSGIMTDEKKQQFWFELGISPASIVLPAVHVPSNGLQLYWPTAEELPAGLSGGASSMIAGGITTHEYWAMPLESLVQSLTGQVVLTNDLAQQKVSLLFSSKSVLPWAEKLKPVLDHLGLGFEVIIHKETQRRYIFGQIGGEIQTSEHRFKGSTVNADSNGYEYNFKKTPLQQVIVSLLGNCNRQGAYTAHDTLEFIWTGEPALNPFEIDIDLECTIPRATFTSNVEFLKEHFGLTMTMEEVVTRVPAIRLTKK